MDVVVLVERVDWIDRLIDTQSNEEQVFNETPDEIAVPVIVVPKMVVSESVLTSYRFGNAYLNIFAVLSG